ncbi:cilia- and flagella-associated protein 47 [Temnothorax americanus]|uniref:cilia- and flagella-associated protein 47 n=1 Tax=Temnothorax americanus TaxID=1964332 RepID=UPI0040692EC5
MTNLSTTTITQEMQTILSTNELTTGIRYDDVYISPSHIKFDEAFEGVTYRQRIIIKNIGYKPAFIRIRQLNFIAFQVKALKSGIRISPGLSITTYVTYTFKRTSISHAIIPIEINGKIFDYHVISTVAIEYISIEPKLIDFGTIDIGYSSGLKIVTIRNEGSKSTRFAIDLGQNDLDLMIKPLRGRIKPQKEIKLQVELMGVNEGPFYSEFWIKSTPNIRVPIKVRVIVPKLVVYHTNTTGDFTLIDFPPTVENTWIEPVKDIATDNSLSQRIYIQESMMEISSMLMSRASSTDSGICDVIKLCLYGEVEAVQLHLEPDTLHFGDLIVGQISQRVLRLTNPSAVAPIYLECAPNAAARCCPNWTRLKPKTSIEILVKVCGKESIEPSFKLLFNVAADSYDSTASRRRFGRIKVGSYFVECTVNIIFKSKKGLLNDDEEIMNRLLRSPKWKLLYKDYSEVISRFAGNIRSPFKKSISTTKAAVLIPLSPLQIYKVHIYPTTFAFGMVAPNSFNYRRLVVKNTNNVPVMIRLISLSTKSIYFPEGHLMILQPGSTMTRLVEYFADGVNKFNGYINYVINDNHSFELNITAYIVQKQLYIDKREIEFGKEWSRGEVYRPLASVVRITNKLDAKICFRWEVPAASGFYIEPRSGSVRGNATLHVYVRYEHSDNARDNYAQALMRCESGSRVSLRLSVPRFVPGVEFVSDNANLGEIPLNLPTRVVAVLQNFEFNEVTYEIDSASLIRGCNVNQLRGKISPRGIAILEVYLTFDVCCRFTTTIAVTIQGCLQLLYRINGSVSFPRLKLLPQRIDVKRLSIDALQIHQITATNVGTTLLKVQVLLEEHPEFHVSLLENGKSLEIGTEGITIVPGASQTLYLHFQPVDLASYAFYLPIVINQLLGPVSMLNPKSIRPAEFLKSHEAHYAHLPGFAITPLPDKLPTISIDYTVASRVIFFSKLSFRFYAATNELSEELFIENRATSREIAMSINIEEFNKADCPFAIDRSHGAEIRRTLDSIECTLRPGGSVSFVLEFKPRRRGSFSAEVPIYVCGEPDDGVFNKLRLDGEFPASSIDVEPTEIYFTAVPLGAVIGEKFRIRARHFDNTAFIRPNFLTTTATTPRCSVDHKDELLRVEFPNGNVVSPKSYVELEARITFKSDQPVSFCLTIEFSDDRALAACFLTVYATADNNLLTTYMYPMKPTFDKTYGRYLDKRVSCPSVSSDSATDEDDYDNEGISRTRRHSELLESRLSITSHFNDQSRSFVDKTTDSKLHWNKERNDNGIGNENIQVDGKRTLNDNGKRVSIRKRPSALSMSFGTRNRKFSDRLLQLSYSASDRKDDYEKHMGRIMTIMEEWMYSGPLKFCFYPNIPYGITAAFSYLHMKKRSYVRNSKQENGVPMLSFIDVLESLVGPNIRTYLGELSKQLLPENDIERIDYILQLYNKILDFLLSQGAYLVHVSPQFLLNYNDYLISIDIVLQSNARRKRLFNTNCVPRQRLPRQLFESRNKQSWLDVISQTYKCFVLRGIHERKFWTSPPTSPRRSTVYRESIVSSTSRSVIALRNFTIASLIGYAFPSLPKQYDLHERAIQSIANSPSCELASDNRCAEEKFLLAWLQYHYEQQRARDWMTDRRVILSLREKQDVAERRTIQNFNYDLSDSLVLIAATAAYCPFLIDECFSNLYICPRNKQEMLHNAICLVTAWRKIRLGFIITPMQLVNPNQVQILMLVVHLFQVLPTYVPRAKIKFSCPLSQTVTKQISVSNPTDNIVNYLLLLVNDVNRFYTILKPVSVLRLNAHGSGQIQIQFHAKKIRKNRAYLVLCGRAIGPYFGRNQTIVLEGHIDNLGIASEYTIRSKLYEIVETNLKINVPYQNAAEYEIWMTDERPSHPSTLKITRWRELRARKIPKRLFLNQESIVVAEGASKAQLSISVACITPKQRTFWLIFQAKTGDFIIQINSFWQTSVNDRLVVEWTAQGECICSNQRSGVRDNCPFNVSLPVPSCNVQLRKCVAQMFQKTLESKERMFWSKYLNTHIELRLIKWLMGDDVDSAALEFVHVFNTAVTYKVTISDKLSPLILPECFTIQGK